MRNNLLKICLLIFSLGFICTGCSKTELLELKNGSEEAIIEYDVDGLHFTFCLLDEDSIPSTSFKEGENFRLYFAIKNNTNDHLEFNDYGFYHLNDFLAVKSAVRNYGKPFEFVRPSLTEEIRYILLGGYALFSVNWHENREEFYAMHGYFKGLEKPFLEKGKYHTQFTYKYKIGHITTPKLTFRINFEIN